MAVGTKRKLAAVQRLMREESLDTVSRDLNVPVHRLTEWREKVLMGSESALKERERDASRHLGREKVFKHLSASEKARAYLHLYQHYESGAILRASVIRTISMLQFACQPHITPSNRQLAEIVAQLRKFEVPNDFILPEAFANLPTERFVKSQSVFVLDSSGQEMAERLLDAGVLPAQMQVVCKVTDGLRRQWVNSSKLAVALIAKARQRIENIHVAGYALIGRALRWRQAC